MNIYQELSKIASEVRIVEASIKYPPDEFEKDLENIRPDFIKLLNEIQVPYSDVNKYTAYYLRYALENFIPKAIKYIPLSVMERKALEAILRKQWSTPRGTNPENKREILFKKVKLVHDILENSLERYKKEFELKDEDIEIYVKDLELGKYFEEFVKIAQNKDIIQLGSNYIITNPSTRNISVSKLIDTMHMVVEGELSSTSAKLILKELEEKDEDPKKIAEEKGLIQISDKKKLEVVAKKVISNNTKAVDEYKKGKMSSLQFLVGQTMKEMKGSGNPKLLQKIFEDLLS